MKRILISISILLSLWVLSKANDFSSSMKGYFSSVTYTHSSACDSARVYFGYPSSNLYQNLKLFPLDVDSSKLKRDSLALDSIGGHYVEIQYYERGAGSVSGYFIGLWEQKPDTSDYQGSAAGLTADQVAGEVYCTLYVHADDFKDGTAGTGADTFDLYVFNADTTAQEGIEISILNEAHTAVAVPVVPTDVNGKAQVFLDADTYHLYLQRLGVIYSKWDTVIVPSGGGVDTIWVTSYDPGAPPSASVTLVQGFNRDLGYNKTDRLTIRFIPQHSNLIDTTQGVFLDFKELVAYSDTGFFQTYVVPSINMISREEGVDVDSILYDVKIERNYTETHYFRNVFVPRSAGGVWLKDILE